MNILVTGGAGYIGSHATRILLDNNYNVSVIDNLSTGYLYAVDKRAKFHEIDILDKEKVAEVLIKDKIDAVIHFAAFSIVPESMKDPLKYYTNNVCGTKSLLEAMHMSNVKYIVFSSSAAVYGEQKVFPIIETALEVPTNPYGETKLAMEKMMKWADKAYGIKFISLRYFNVAGAHYSTEIGENHNPETHLIPIILQAILEQKSFKVFGADYNTPDKSAVRDYIHVEDLINAHILAMEYLVKNQESDIFNLGSGKGFSVFEIVNAAEKVTNIKAIYDIAPRRAGDPETLIASSEKAEKVLGWKRKYNDIQDIIASAYNYYKGKE